MNEWTCDECKHKDVSTTTFPCCDCLDGDRFEPEEGTVSGMLEINGDIGKAREQQLRDRQKRRQEHKEAMIRENVRRNQRKDGERNADD